MQLITKLITPARSVPKFPILSKGGSFSSSLLFSFSLLLTYTILLSSFFESYPKEKEKEKKRKKLYEALENFLDLLFPITCADFLLASTFFLSFLPRFFEDVPRQKRTIDKRKEENFFQEFHTKIFHKNFE